DNSYHVVTASETDSTAVLDGFTVRDGEADAGAFPHDRGGGLLVIAGSPTVRHCTFRDDDASELGGGLHVEGGSPLIEDTVFEDNAGGLWAWGASPVIRRVVFRRNFAALTFIFGSGGLVEDVLVEDNE